MAKDVEARLRLIEDQLAIYQVVAAHPCAIDGRNGEMLGELYVENGAYAVGDTGRFEGRAGVQAMASSPGLGKLIDGGAGHIVTLPYVEIDGDKAVATGHGMLIVNGEGGFAVARLSAARYELERQVDGRWQVTLRTQHLIDGNPAGPAMLGRLKEVPEAVAA